MALVLGQNVALSGPAGCRTCLGNERLQSRSSENLLNKETSLSVCRTAAAAAGTTQRRLDARHSDKRFVRTYAKKRVNSIDDPFNFGEDEDLEDGDLMSTGKQTSEVPKPPPGKERDEYGFLKFPQSYNVEIASLGVYIRNDVRRCLCWVDGGVYENILFFPAIQLLKSRYPGVKIDVVAGDRGKQVYEMNKYINTAHAFDTGAEWTAPATLIEFLGLLRNEYYDLILSTKPAGFKHCATIFMIGGRTRRVSYVPGYHSEWVSNKLLTEAIVAPRENMSEGGYNMYSQMLEYLAQPAKGVPEEKIPPLQLGVSKRVRTVVGQKALEAGLSEGKYLIFHGISSDSAASMTSLGDPDSLLSLELCARLFEKLQAAAGLKVVVIAPHEKEIKRVIDACGDGVTVLSIKSPGQLGGLIQKSAGVVSTNTAAMLMAVAMGRPSVALFGSAEKADTFAPPQASKLRAVASRTGKLAGLDIDEAVSAWKYVYSGPLVLTA